MDEENKVKVRSEKEEVRESTVKSSEMVKDKPKYKKWLSLCLGMLVLIGVGIGAYFLLQNKDDGGSQAAIMDVNGQLGTNGNREEEMKKMMDESMVAVSMNSMPYFETGSSAGDAKD